MKLERVRVITSYTGKARFLAQCSDAPIGFIPRQKDIPSPYAYSPTHTVFDWQGLPVIIVETSHKHYEVFVIPPSWIVKDEDELMRRLFPS